MNWDDVASSADAAYTGTPLDHRLLSVSTEPWNAETRLPAHIGVITPSAAFYKRNHFPIPHLSPSVWQLAVAGAVTSPFALTYDELLALPRRTLLVTLECAGNARMQLQPPAEGEPWGYGAVSTAEWTGVPLHLLLERAHITPAARELVFEGADAGLAAAAGATIAYTRSLPLAQAIHPDTLLAYAMNGEPLPAAHGFPLRLIVPGWYGMAAVKWLTRIEAVPEPFQGFFQVRRYILPHPERGEADPIPLTTMGVRAVITDPAPDAALAQGQYMLRGLAWSGAAPIASVEVSTDAGVTWHLAELSSEQTRYAWRRWEYSWEATTPGPATLQCRAFDKGGNAQPATPAWNRLGYANNAVQSIPVLVR
jgi:DMSO/TMAO reductase YedYZ molybdopterin-dependent catalytic subunit